MDLSLKVVPTEKEKEKQVRMGTVRLHNTSGIQTVLTFIRAALSIQMLFFVSWCVVYMLPYGQAI